MDSGRAPAGILVPLDGSPLAEQALPYARALLAPNATLTLLEVVEEPEPVPGMWGQTFAEAEEVRRLGERLALDDLKRAEAALGAARPAARLEVVAGDPAEQILRVAAERGVGLIAMTTHGRGALGRWVFGSVADRVARAAATAVLLVRPTEGEARPVAIRRLVVPLDGSALAAEALPVARDLAARLDVPIHLVAVVDPTRAVPVEAAPIVAFDPEVLQQTVDRLQADAEETLAEARGWLQRQGLRADLEVATGSPFEKIVDATRDDDLIVMASHGRGGALRWLLGSVAEKLVREAPVPVVLVPVAARHAAAG